MEGKKVSRERGINAAALASWRDSFLFGGQLSLKSRREDALEEVKRDMRAKIGELTMENELLHQKARTLVVGLPLASSRSNR